MSALDARARFRPAWWLRNRHAQTLAGRFLRSAAAVPLERRRIDTPDGDFLDLDFAPAPAEDAPIVVVLHGLEGSTRREYISLMLRELFDRGLRGVGMNFRGCGGEPNRSACFYHSGETGDLAHVVDVLRDRYPGCPIGGAGFSLGGNVLLKYLGERGQMTRRSPQPWPFRFPSISPAARSACQAASCDAPTARISCARSSAR